VLPQSYLLVAYLFLTALLIGAVIGFASAFVIRALLRMRLSIGPTLIVDALLGAVGFVAMLMVPGMVLVRRNIETIHFDGVELQSTTARDGQPALPIGAAVLLPIAFEVWTDRKRKRADR
jgi:hypothetical protein